MPYPPQKKLLKRKEKNITPAKTNTPISQTSSERLKVTIFFSIIIRIIQKSKINKNTHNFALTTIFCVVRGNVSVKMII